jgi:predicted nucleic acid-binding protein
VITVDTNVLLYTIDPRNAHKQAAARRVIAAVKIKGHALALQCVGEFQNVALRKFRAPVDRVVAYASAILDDFRTFPASRTAARLALAEVAAARLSYWDAVMLASAAEAGCTAMLSEDMQDRTTIFGVEIVNPFGADGVSPRAAELLQLT